MEIPKVNVYHVSLICNVLIHLWFQFFVEKSRLVSTYASKSAFLQKKLGPKMDENIMYLHI